MSKLFNTITIEINSLCNRKCIFCPNYKNQRTNEFLDFSLIEKIAKELKDLKFKGRIGLTLYNEPTLDKRICKIAKCFYKEVPSAVVSIFTNGDYINSVKDLEKLLNSKIRQMQINCYDKKTLDKIVPIVNTVKSSGKYKFRELPNIERKPPRDTYNIIVVDKTKPLSLTGFQKLQNRSGQISWFIKPRLSPQRKPCARPFRMMAIDYKGNIVLCCNDYFSTVTFGNITNKTIKGVWYEDAELRRYRSKLIKGDRDIALCDACSFDGGVFLHMLKYTWKELVDKNEVQTKLTK